MLKGINRRIIEINRTNNEYFEKAILFVRGDKLDIPPQILSCEANSYLSKLIIPKKKKRLKREKLLIFSIFAVCILLALMTLIIIF